MSYFHRGCTPILSRQRQSRIPASWLLYYHSVLSIRLILPTKSSPIKGVILCYLFIYLYTLQGLAFHLNKNHGNNKPEYPANTTDSLTLSQGTSIEGESMAKQTTKF